MEPTVCSELNFSQLVISIGSRRNWRPRKLPCSHITQLQQKTDTIRVELVARPSLFLCNRWPEGSFNRLFLTCLNTHQPLLTLSDRMWLLKPSSTMLMISVSMVISLPSRHSRPNREMEGTVNVWTGRGGGSERIRGKEYRATSFFSFLTPALFSPSARPWWTGWRSWAGIPCWLNWGSLLQRGRTGSRCTVYARRSPSWNTEKSIRTFFLLLFVLSFIKSGILPTCIHILFYLTTLLHILYTFFAFFPISFPLHFSLNNCIYQYHIAIVTWSCHFRVLLVLILALTHLFIIST